MKFHEESPDLSAVAMSRLLFITSLRRSLHARLGAGNRHLYALHHARPDDATASGPAAATRRRELREELEAEPFFQAWSSTLRASQDLMWRFIGAEIERDLPRLRERYAARRASAAGSVRTVRDLPMPPYLSEADTHRMPGSYFADDADDDLRAGALYDVGGSIYQLAGGNTSGGMLNDSRGRALVAFLRWYYPRLAPARILDLGCGVGNNTVPLADAYPEAEVTGLDIGAPMVRFAHLRAEGLGRKIHFMQGDAEHTDLPAAHFDLVVSQIMLHEMSPPAVERVFAESARLLRPGGVAVHVEVPFRFRDLDVLSQFLASWEQYYNAESNIDSLADTDLSGLMRDAGFTDVREGYAPIPPPGRMDAAELSAAPGKAFSSWLVVSGTRG